MLQKDILGVSWIELNYGTEGRWRENEGGERQMAGMTAQRRGDSETKSKGPRASTSTSQQLAVLTLSNHCLLFMVNTFQRQPRTFLEHTGSPLVTTLPLELKTVFIHPSIHSLNFTIAQCQDAALGVLRSTRPTPCPEKISLWGEDSEVKRPSSHAVTAPWLCGGETVGVLGGGRERLSPGGDTEGPIVARAWDLRFKPQVVTHRRKWDRDCPGSTVFIGEGSQHVSKPLTTGSIPGSPLISYP